LIEDYFLKIDAIITKSAGVDSYNVTYDKRTSFVASVRGEIFFLDGSALHIREFVDVQTDVERYLYAYHYQRLDGTMVFRYDNTPRYDHLSTYPYHKHDGSESLVVGSEAMDLRMVLNEIQGLMTESRRN
jgi:hypothetical protein